MDKSILDKLIKFGLVTNVNVDASKYKDVDDLIVKGLITVPGAKQKIHELIGDLNVEKDIEETSTEPTTEPVIDDPIIIAEDPIVETLPVEEATVIETPVEETTETPVDQEPVIVEETSVEETTETPKKTTKKSPKKTE